MARSKIDLQRFRKIYPQLKSGPRYFTQNNEVETHKITFSDEPMKTFGVGIYNYPVVVVTPEDNINVWVSAISRVEFNGAWSISISTSSNYTGVVHVHVAEGNP